MEKSIAFMLFAIWLYLFLRESLILIFETIQNRRNSYNKQIPKVKVPEGNFLEIKEDPVEVTFDNKLFLVFDKEKDEWDLEEREENSETDKKEKVINQLLSEIQKYRMISLEEKQYFRVESIKRLGISSPCSDCYKKVPDEMIITIHLKDEIGEKERQALS